MIFLCLHSFVKIVIALDFVRLIRKFAIAAYGNNCLVRSNRFLLIFIQLRLFYYSITKMLQNH